MRLENLSKRFAFLRNYIVGTNFHDQYVKSSQVYFHYTYVSRIRKQETAKRPCGHQSRLHLVAIYLKILKVINFVMTYNKQTKINTSKKAQTG